MDKLINWEKGKDEVVITFISILELARLGKLDVFQNEPDGSIYVEVINSLDSFDVETADGFEPEDEDPKSEPTQEVAVQETITVEVQKEVEPIENSQLNEINIISSEQEIEQPVVQ
jgi:segregation and condensation protein A